MITQKIKQPPRCTRQALRTVRRKSLRLPGKFSPKAPTNELGQSWGCDADSL